uniref:Uncharacterized protein n=1 Tax=Lygus hesperus TaxID=30085 RepID=A0A146MA68_LYGHE
MSRIAATVQELFSTNVNVPTMVPTALPSSVLLQHQRTPSLQMQRTHSFDGVPYSHTIHHTPSNSPPGAPPSPVTSVVSVTSIHDGTVSMPYSQQRRTSFTHAPSQSTTTDNNTGSVANATDHGKDVSQLIATISPFLQGLQVEILKKTLLQFVLYYRRFLDILQKLYPESPPAFVQDLVPLRDVICEIRRYNSK